jgi:hypothetical protein
MDEPPALELKHGHQQSTMACSLVLLFELSRPKEPTTKALPKKQQREKSISFTAQSEVGTEC